MDRNYWQTLPSMINRFLWSRDERSWNELFGPALNEERAKAGLAPVDNVREYIFTDRPWLAADSELAPAPPANGINVTETGAWFLSDDSSLPHEQQNFLANGEAPVYLGFGSMRAAESTSRVLIEAARALQLRSIVSQAAARAGKPQLIVPHHYDQPYCAHRVRGLGVGASGPAKKRLSVGAIASALRECLRPEVAERAQELASRIERRGAAIAAKRLVSEFG
jgi:vancomycin aglycone glucosyltransferase